VVLETAKTTSETEAKKRIEELSTRIKELNDQAMETRKEIGQALRGSTKYGQSDEALRNSQGTI